MSSVAKEIRTRLGDSASLLDALDAMTHRSAFAVLAGTIVAFGLSFAILSGLSAVIGMKVAAWLGAVLGFISFIACFGLLLVGSNAAGIMLMDEARGGQSRPAREALLVSAFTSHRVLAVALIEGLLFVAYLLALGLVLLICKIPGLGPLLYAVAFPVAALATGLVFFAMFYVALPMALPALWSGRGILATVAILLAVARQRLMYVVIAQILLGLLVFFLGALIGGVLGIGTSVALSFSALVLSAGSDLAGVMAMLAGMFTGMGGGEGSGYVWALGVGFLVIFLCGAVPPALVAMRGLCSIFVNATADLSVEEAEAKLRERLGDLKARAQQAREAAMAKAAAAAASATAPAATPAPIPAPADPVAAPVCSGCGQTVDAQDLFCAHCGQKQR
jgi:hypothetical protein